MNKLVAMLMMCGVVAASPVERPVPNPDSRPAADHVIHRPKADRDHSKRYHKKPMRIMRHRVCPHCGCLHTYPMPGRQYRRVPHHGPVSRLKK